MMNGSEKYNKRQLILDHCKLIGFHKKARYANKNYQMCIAI